MKRTLLILFISLLEGTLFLQADPVSLSRKTNTSTHQGGNKAPALPWCIDLTDNIITMSATPSDYTLNLYDEDGEIVYSVLGSRGRFY